MGGIRAEDRLFDAMAQVVKASQQTPPLVKTAEEITQALDDAWNRGDITTEELEEIADGLRYYGASIGLTVSRKLHTLIRVERRNG